MRARVVAIGGDRDAKAGIEDLSSGTRESSDCGGAEDPFLKSHDLNYRLLKMDNREFENYLTLLSGLLQIRGEQREAIARELQAHLEDRLDDLLARGMDRDEAVKLALSEFGDAAGLAANFSLLVRNRRRRWLVKMTSFSTAALVLLALGVVAIWPEHRPGPAPARAVAQNQGGQKDKGGGQPGVPGGAPAVNTVAAPTEGLLSEKLSQRMTAEFVETPLKDVLAFLSDHSDVQIFLNRKAIENEGLSLDDPVTINLKNVRLDMLLDLVLEQASSNGLTYVERDGILIVSTMSNLEGASEVRVYNCRDLLSDGFRADAAKGMPGVPGVGMPGMSGGVPGPAPGAGAMPPGGLGGPAGSAAPGSGGGAPPGMMAMGGLGGGGFGGGAGEAHPLTESQQRAESLKQLIQTAVKPSSWSEVGGIGTISEYNGLIVINHDAKTHKQVENVLRMLREAAGLEPGKALKAAKH